MKAREALIAPELRQVGDGFIQPVRDGFTIPRSEQMVLGTPKQRPSGAARPAKKSALQPVRIQALASKGDAALFAALAGVATIRTGRPAAKAVSPPKIGKAPDAAADKH